MNALFVSIAFPPKRDPESLQVAKYFKYLSRSEDISWDVLTSKNPTLNLPTDPSLETYNQGWEQQVSLPIWENRYTNFVLRKLTRGNLDKPDSKYSFYWQWRSALRQLNRTPDIIYSRAFPLSSHVMAYRLQKQTGIPWVMHLSDPWFPSAIHTFTPSQARYHQAMERTCFEAATAVQVTSQKTKELYAAIYPEHAHKIGLSPNVYDPDDLIENPLVWGDKLRIVYTGGWAGTRTPEPILKGLALAHKQAPDLNEILELVLVGEADRAMSAVMDAHPSPMVKRVPPVPFTEALTYQRSAHLLLAADSPIADVQKAVFFPSKLLDYFLAQRHIWAITTSGSATDEVLREANGSTFAHEDVQGIAQFFLQAVQAYRERNEGFFQRNHIPELYQAPYQAQQLVETLKDVANRGQS